MTWHNDLERMTTEKSHGFTWGKFVKTHNIGNYQIVEYYPYKYNSRTEVENKVEFHSFVCGRDLQQSVNTLDEALLLAICGSVHYESAFPHICRMLNL